MGVYMDENRETALIAPRSVWGMRGLFWEISAVIGRGRAGVDGPVGGFDEVIDNFAVIQVAAGNRKADRITTLGRALSSANNVLAPPLGGTKAFTEGQVAGLVELTGINLEDAAGGSGYLKLELR